jgi:hypothetical protein
MIVYILAILCLLFTPLFLCAQVNLLVTYPDDKLQPGNSLFVRGDGLGLNWNSGLALQHSAANQWTISLDVGKDDLERVAKEQQQHSKNSRDSQSGGDFILNFKTLVDDQAWQVGANEQLSLSSQPQRDYTYRSYPFYIPQQGSYSVVASLYSPQLKNTRQVVVYFPPSYAENYLKPFADVLIMHDGQNLFNASTSAFGVAWECQEALDALILEGKMREILAVGLYNTPNRINEYTYGFDKSVGAGEFILLLISFFLFSFLFC